MKLLSKSVFIISSIMAITSCKKEESTTTAIVPLAAQDYINVRYAAGTDTAQRMDVYLPAGRNVDSTKVLFMIHGGAWIAGDKADFNDVVNSLKIQLPDYAIFNVNYRLANPTTFVNLWPTQIRDIDSAFTFMKSKAAEYKINSNKVVMFGASAGAQLALLKGYQNPTTNNVKAVVDLFGPTDLKGLYDMPPVPTYPSLLTLFLSGTPTTNPTSYASGSPLLLVNNQVPPTIIFHGTIDNTVPIRQSDSLNARLTVAGVTKEYYQYPGQGHGWTDPSLLLDTYAKTIAFIKRIVR